MTPEDRLLDVLLTEQRAVPWDDLIGLAGPEHEEEAEELRRAARIAHGRSIIVRSGLAVLRIPEDSRGA